MWLKAQTLMGWNYIGQNQNVCRYRSRQKLRQVTAPPVCIGLIQEHPHIPLSIQRLYTVCMGSWICLVNLASFVGV